MPTDRTLRLRLMREELRNLPIGQLRRRARGGDPDAQAAMTEFGGEIQEMVAGAKAGFDARMAELAELANASDAEYERIAEAAAETAARRDRRERAMLAMTAISCVAAVAAVFATIAG